MFVPVGERCTLAKGHWWGGWVENEQCDTLIRYLLDEPHTHETDYSDALAPRSRNANESLMGEHSLVQPATAEQVRAMMTSFNTNISDLRNRMVHLERTVQELASTISTNFAPLSGTTNMHRANSANPTGGLTIKIPPLAVLGTTSKRNTAATTIEHPSPGRACDSPSIFTSDDSGTMPPTSVAHSSHTSQSHAGPENPNASVAGTSSGRTDRQRTLSSHFLPTAGLVIPDVPVRNPNGSRRPKSESWRDIVKHWTEGDPSLGLHTPLRDWPPDWTRGSNRLFAVKYHQRSLIALEFLNAYQSDEARFLAAYPEAKKSHTALVHAINAARQARGERKVRAWRGLSRPSS